jgi:hypothetical protein
MIDYSEIFYKFLAASYLYYIMDEETPWRDSLYDMWARDLLDHWEEWDHAHKRLISQDDLRAGTLYALKETEYPPGVIKFAKEWQAECMV